MLDINLDSAEYEFCLHNIDLLKNQGEAPAQQAFCANFPTTLKMAIAKIPSLKSV
jgi:hypothetical protein